MNITALPNDIFLLIVAFLSPKELILSRRVSKQFHDAFTELELNRHVLVQHYPRARELRNEDQNSSTDWSDLFSKVARRYHHLKSGTPRGIEKLPLGSSFIIAEWSQNCDVAPWQRHLRFEKKEAPFHYPDTLWTYEEGLLIFPSADLQQYALFDLEAGTISEVNFEPEKKLKKLVRRLRLHERVLVVEWCEDGPYHQLNEFEMVFRHFASAYDVVKDPAEGKWKTIFRNEWKIHFLGMPLNKRDRFFSYHTADKYALYLWQPNRSAWGEDEPIEALAVWDITSPSPYLPSQDHSGKGKPDDRLEGPRVVRRFSFTDLDFYRIRQRSTPVLRGLGLDEGHVYVIEEDHRWIVGQQAGHALPRLHKVKTIGIPFAIGPMWVDSCGADGDNSKSFCQRVSDSRHHNLAPCWRHEEFPYLTVAEARDDDAGVVFSARHCFMLETISINLKPKVHMTGHGYEISLRDDLWHQLLAGGKICGDERWLIGENHQQRVVIVHFDRGEMDAKCWKTILQGLKS